MNEGHRDLLRKCRGDIIREIAAANCLEDILNELGYKDQNGDYGLTPEDITRIRVLKSVSVCVGNLFH